MPEPGTPPDLVEVSVACGNPSKAARLCNGGRLTWGEVQAQPHSQEGRVVVTGRLELVMNVLQQLRWRELIGRKSHDEALFALEFWAEPHKHLSLNIQVSADTNRRLREILPLVAAHARSGDHVPGCVQELADTVQKMLDDGKHRRS